METTDLPANNSLKPLSLGELQKVANLIYGAINSPYFELTDMLARVSEYCSRICLWVRKGEAERTDYHLCMVLSWLFAITNRLFPPGSPTDISTLIHTHCQIELPSTVSLAELQKACADKHADVDPHIAVLCLAEKALALSSSLGKYRVTHENEHLQLSSRRIAQIVESLLVVAEAYHIRLSETYERYFANGCPKCRQMPCGCGFRVDTVK